MKAIIYISDASVEFDASSLQTLAENAAIHNSNEGITGYLWLKKKQFVQYIEGEAQALNALMLRIEADKRHKVLYKVEEATLKRQRFPDWHMRYIEGACEINLESILSELLCVLNRAYGSNDKLAEGVWRIADAISHRNAC